jgi:hypothetical protein
VQCCVLCPVIVEKSGRLSQEDYNVQMEIINTIKELDLYTQWVKGHQDDNSNLTQLSYESKLNINADHQATST